MAANWDRALGITQQPEAPGHRIPDQTKPRLRFWAALSPLKSQKRLCRRLAHASGKINKRTCDELFQRFVVMENRPASTADAATATHLRCWAHHETSPDHHHTTKSQLPDLL
jgi:hypothetical protein